MHQGGALCVFVCLLLLPLVGFALPRGAHFSPKGWVSPCNQTDSTLSCESKKGTAGACELLRTTHPEQVTKAPKSGGSVPKVDPNKPASEVLRGGAKREFPGEHLNKSLNEIRELLKTADGATRCSLQKATRFLEQQDRILDE